MTTNRDFKRIVRARMQKTGESYTAARAQLRVAPPGDHDQKAGMRGAVVRERTGRDWPEWVALLDAAGAREWTHTSIAKHVKAHGVTDWWSQSVTVGYERICGLREIGQRRSGSYEASRSRTVPVSVDDLFAWFASARRRPKWLPGIKVVVRKATAPRSIRMTWPDGTSVEGWFVARGPSKSSVQVQHTKLPDRAAAATQRTWWGERLDALEALLSPSKKRPSPPKRQPPSPRTPGPSVGTGRKKT